MLFNTPYAEATCFAQPFVNSGFTLALVGGLTVPDMSENAAANLAWSDIRLPKPVFVSDTLWAESEILEKRRVEVEPERRHRHDALPRHQPAA
jgi:itaconyl-CoA hydratase